VTEQNEGLKLAAWAAMAGTSVLKQLRDEGKLRPEHFWVSLRGSTKYVRAVAAGDLALPQVVKERLAQCEKCPALVPENSLPHAKPGWCGPPLEEHMTGPVRDRTCGCLLIGKVHVQKEVCPRGKW